MLTVLSGGSSALAFVSTGDGGWVWQNPLPQGDQITAVDFVDSYTGWAVGGWLDAWNMAGHGVIMQTRDGGLTWHPQYRGANRLNDVCFIDHKVGWAVGDKGTVLKTKDGGNTWQTQPSGTAANLASVDFVDADNGWAVAGPSGISPPREFIFHTADGGATWEVQLDSGPLGYRPLYAVDFVSATTGWAVGDGRILRTTDGGVTWARQWGHGGRSSFFLDATTGWAAGGGGTILHTTDAGLTWNPQEAGTSEGLTGLAFVSQTSGWAVGAGGVVLHTADAGATWVAQDSGTTTDLTGVDFVSPTEGWTAGEILHTTTAGSLWTPQSSSVTRQDLSAVDFVDLLNGWAVGALGTIVHTADAGVSWTQQISGTSDDLTSVDFVDRWNGWAVGGTDAHSWPPDQTRTILHTGDGGLTWEMQLNPSGSFLEDVEFVDSLSGWAVGDGGTILHTTNGGTSWYPQDSGTTAHLASVSFVSASSGWAASGGSIMVHTTDGGATWEPQSIPLRAGYDEGRHVNSIDFLNETTGWAAGSTYEGSAGGNYGDLYQTTDGGATWRWRPGFIRGPLESVCFLDEAHGWAVGRFGAPVHTSDGGATWQKEESGAALLNSVCFVTVTEGWAVGAGGAILHTVTGGLPDTKSPITNQRGADDLWRNSDRTVSFSAADPDAPNSSGVAYTEYAIDGGTWTEGAELTVPAPADHSNDGIHTIRFRSHDSVGNLEPSQSCEVKIDTTAPVITLNTPWEGATLIEDQAMQADWWVSDAASGVASAEGHRGKRRPHRHRRLRRQDLQPQRD